MPRGDGTGPAGQGPRTGRGAGYCTGNRSPGFRNPGLNRGRGGRGAGVGFARGGRGYGITYPPGSPPNSVWSNGPPK